VDLFLVFEFQWRHVRVHNGYPEAGIRVIYFWEREEPTRTTPSLKWRLAAVTQEGRKKWCTSTISRSEGIPGYGEWGKWFAEGNWTVVANNDVRHL